MSTEPSGRTPQLRMPYLTGIVLLYFRGVLLWVAVPVAVLFWAATFPLWHRRNVGLRQIVGWVDLNLIAALHRSFFRPLVRHPLRWVPVAELPSVTHRVHLLDSV